jgi:CSLREA domain-containing protein
MRLLTRLCCALFVVLLSLLSPLIPPTASASDFTVNSLADTPDANTSDGLCADANGVCTLRAAIQQANADPSGDVIGVRVTGTINLTSALPNISTSMTIDGQGAGLLTVRRNRAEPYRIFTIGAGAGVRISGLAVSNGLAPPPVSGGDPGGGGGIYNAGDLTLAGVTVSDNATSIATAFPVGRITGGGGGIQNDGVLTMTDCVVSGNRTGNGGTASTVANLGAGGGLLNTGTLVMSNCAVSGNHTGEGSIGRVGGNGGAGGGIYNAPNGPRQVSASLTNCLVTGNITGPGGKAAAFGLSFRSGDGGNGGGIYNASAMTVVAGTVSNNLTGRGADTVSLAAAGGLELPAGKGGAGGGVYNDIPPGGGELKMTNCVVSGNRTGAGGLHPRRSQSLDIGDGGGHGGNGAGVANPSAGSVLKMSQCTVVFNVAGAAGPGGGLIGVGGGVYGAARIRSNIIALNVAHSPTTLSDVAVGPFTSLGYNFLGYFGNACCFTGTDRGDNDAGQFLNIDQNTLVPLPDSPALDAGLARDVDDHPVTADRRGAARPFDFPGVAPQPGGDDSDIGAFERQAAEPPPAQTTVQLASSIQFVAEGCSQTEVTVTRTGPKDGTTEVFYVVADFEARQRGDFTHASGRITFAPGEDTKTIHVLISDDAYAEGTESLVVELTPGPFAVLGTPREMKLQIVDDEATDGATNPIDDNATFVGQHYHDFLNRHADPDGQAFWAARLEECGGDAACLDRRRVDVSAAFFLSTEFLNTGYYVIRVNKAGLGDRTGNPDYFQFLEQTRGVGRGVIVGRPGHEALLEANKRRYAEEFVQRSDFLAAHNGQTAAQYVDSLFANAGVTPTTDERDAAINAFGTGDTAGRVAALRSVVEAGSVFNKLYNPSFVLMQYFGYLRRNPNAPPDKNFDGYLFWLEKLDGATLPGEDARDETVAIRRVRRAEMVRAFLRSTEYRGRFGGDPSRGNP